MNILNNYWFGLQCHITNKYDQRCKHCYIYNNEEGMDNTNDINLYNAKKIIDDFLHFCKTIKRRPSITITGGDPLLYKDIWSVLKYINMHNIKFSIFGNPFHLNNSICKKLKELGCRNYQMSIDGLQETHDNIRKKGHLCNIIKNINIKK